MVASDSLSLNMSCQALDCKKDFSHLNLEGFKRMRVKKNIARTEGFGIFLGSFLEKKKLSPKIGIVTEGFIHKVKINISKEESHTNLNIFLIWVTTFMLSHYYLIILHCHPVKIRDFFHSNM
jgi:hypothetical protein